MMKTERKRTLREHMQGLYKAALEIMLGHQTVAGPKASARMGTIKARAVVTGHRSKYIPAGPQRNCGHRGISPKSYTRALDAATS